jgi:hypothetical protein
MAVYRPIHITYCQDKFVLSLTPEQKFFYLYLMINSKTKQCGIYELPKNVICFETGYNLESVNKLLKIFIDYGKIKYNDDTDEIFIINWIKYNPINNRNILTCVLGELGLIKTKTFIKEFAEVVKLKNSGVGSEWIADIKSKTGKSKVSVDFSQVFIEKIKPLTSPLKPNTKPKEAPTKQQSETETETETKEETETETETEYILPVEKAQPPIIDFVEDVINVFKEYYFNNKNVEYISVGKKNKSNYKDRNAVGGLLKYLKEKYPGEDSATTLNRMRSLFNQCFKINDTWLKNNMTLDTIFNKLNNIILYGQAGNKEPGATNKPKFDPDAMLRKYYDKKSETINS